MKNRAQQALAKLALEPEWEAHFEPNSYGFRPGRSCHDAIEAIFNSINKKPKYVLDADIAQCFDRYRHSALHDKLATFSAMRRAVKAWLKAGVMDGGACYPTTEGSPQGGVISPLLANVALHGLETAIRAAFTTTEGKPTVIRYADDFVVLHPNRSVIERSQQITAEWLAPIGLELKPSKTRITHTLRRDEGNAGLDFLGMTIRHHPVGKAHAARFGNQWGTRRALGFKTIITPSKDAVRRHPGALAAVIVRHQSAPQAALIDHLNPIIRGWTSYYSTVSAKRTFSTFSSLTYRKLRRWAERRHPRKGGAMDLQLLLAPRQGALGARDHGWLAPLWASPDAHPAACQSPRKQEPVRWRLGLLGDEVGQALPTAQTSSDAPQRAAEQVRALWTVLPRWRPTRSGPPHPPVSGRQGRVRQPAAASSPLPRPEDRRGRFPATPRCS